jgi:hypothetical protein
MGTSAITHVHEGDLKSRIILSIYRTCDGGECHKKQLKSFAKDFVIGNGIPWDRPAKFANGMSCLALQLVVHFKECPGHFYVTSAGDMDCNYTYHVFLKKEKLKVK